MGTMDEHYYAVIMAGGGGTRLWPLSRKDCPKQMLELIGDQTLFQIAIQRLDGLFPAERILVVTVAEQARELKKSWPAIPEENYLIEPMPRGTASVVGLAALALQHRDPQAVMAILTADHYIKNETKFRELLRAGLDLAREGYLVTLGISPTYPSTGYGYIQRGEPLGKHRGLDAYRVLRFKEKPGEAQAKQMIASGDHAWNSGMFVWRVNRILEAFDRHMPELAEKLREISGAWGTRDQGAVVQRVWPTIHPETIDYGIMERANQVAVLPAAGLGWNDVGSWDSLFDVLTPDENGNIVLGADSINVNSQGSLICDGGSKRLIVTIGVSDLIVVDTGDALLVCDKAHAQDVRKVVNQLKETNRTQYL